MAITADCGHHCGIRCNAEGTVTRTGHCPCPECACPQATGASAAPILLTTLGKPMCWAWYERAGQRRPWDLDLADIIRTGMVTRRQAREDRL